MPLYTYKCDACGSELEKLQPHIQCPNCCGLEMRIVPSFPALIKFKWQGYPSRKKWMDRWEPGTPPMSTGSLHGARY